MRALLVHNLREQWMNASRDIDQRADRQRVTAFLDMHLRKAEQVVERPANVAPGMQVETEIRGVERDVDVHWRPPGRDERSQVPQQPLPFHGRNFTEAESHSRG